MRHANRSLCVWTLAALLVAMSAHPLAAQISGATKGQPVIATGAAAGTSDGSYWDASQFGLSTPLDICVRINAAWSAAIGGGITSATIDARGITGTTLTCSINPFPSGASGKLLLGNSVINTFVTWQIPSRTHLEGMGTAGLTTGTTNNTTIKAASSSVSPVVQLGNGTSLSFDAQLKGMTVDANGATVGIFNDSAEEGSFVEDVNIWNAAGTGLLIQAASSSCGVNQYGQPVTCTPVNSGPYRNINVQYNSECSSCGGANGVAVDVVVPGPGTQSEAIRGIDNVTVSGGGISGTQSIGTCILVFGFPVQVTNSHVEYCATGIQIGVSSLDGFPPTFNVEIQNVSVDTYSGSPNVVITNAADILLSGITGWGTNVLEDNVTGNTIGGTSMAPSYLGYYLLGDFTSPATHTTVISTNAAISTGWVAPGNLHVVDNFSSGNKFFKIDDPLDPTHKNLYHSVVESPDMMNVYNGSITTDKRGTGVVNLPDYFDALNRDFRYQLTAIGSFAQATVVKKIENNRFAIRTSKPGVEVSWQVTGIRRDAYANAHRIQVEEQKPPREQGHYLHPELSESQSKQVATEQAGAK